MPSGPGNRPVGISAGPVSFCKKIYIYVDCNLHIYIFVVM